MYQFYSYELYTSHPPQYHKSFFQPWVASPHTPRHTINHFTTVGCATNTPRHALNPFFNRRLYALWDRCVNLQPQVMRMKFLWFIIFNHRLRTSQPSKYYQSFFSTVGCVAPYSTPNQCVNFKTMSCVYEVFMVHNLQSKVVPCHTINHFFNCRLYVYEINVSICNHRLCVWSFYSS